MVMLRHVRTGQEEGGSVRVLVAGQWRQQRLRHHRAIVRWGESSQGRQSLPVQTRWMRAYTSCAQAHTQRKEQLHLTQQLKSSREPSHTMTENKSEQIVSHSAAAAAAAAVSRSTTQQHPCCLLQRRFPEAAAAPRRI